MDTQSISSRWTERKRHITKLAACSSLATGISLLAIELALALMPQLIPASFRMQYPPYGVEFFVPGVLDRTPVDGVPIPTGLSAFDGPPMHDIADIGMTKVGIELDRRDVPRLVLPADRDGFINPCSAALPTSPSPDVVVLGDSFAALAGQTDPPGLVVHLSRRLGVNIVNLGVPGIGLDHELYLLRNRAIPLRPRGVVWFVYGGNDFINGFFLHMAKNAGIATLGDLHRDSRRPIWILPALISSCGRKDSPSQSTNDLDPVHIRNRSDMEMWLHPDTLRFIALSRTRLESLASWGLFAEALSQGNDAVKASGGQLIVVYIPGKEQASLPIIDDDGALLSDYVLRSSLKEIPVPDSPQELIRLLRENADALEDLVEGHCRSHGIAFWSATPTFRRALEAGTRVYYRADSHWRSEGQALLAPELASRLRSIGIGH